MERSPVVGGNTPGVHPPWSAHFMVMGMKHTLLALLLIASTAFILLPHGGDCMKFYLLGYAGRGVLVPAEICPSPYPGAYVEAGVGGSSFYKSVEVAYQAFNQRHGPIPGIVIRLEGSPLYIDGRSADIAIYSALYCFLNHRKPPYATGVIDDDMYNIDGVMYVQEKLSAAGRGIYVIPYANRSEIGNVPVIAVKNLDELDATLSSLPS